MRPWRIHLGGERNVKNNETVKIQQQQAAANNLLIISSSIFSINRRTSRKKEQKNRKQNCPWYSVVQEQVRVSGTWYASHQAHLRQPRTNWRRGLLRKAATTRDSCVAHKLLGSCRDVRRPRYLPNAKKTAATLQSRPDGTTKKQIPYFGDPQTGEIYQNQVKNRQKRTHFYFLRLRQLSPYQLYHTYVQKSHPTR